MNIWIVHDGITYLLGNPPNLEGLPNRDILQAKYLQGEFADVPEFTELSPDWDGLLNRLLSGNLHLLFQAITLAAFSNPAIFMARQDIYGAISNPAIADRVSALRAGLDMLIQSGFDLTDERKTLWNTALRDLNFPDSLQM